MNRNCQKRRSFRAGIFAFIIALAFTACDMTNITPDNEKEVGPRVISEEERDELEQSGHFLKLVHMPLNTQINNVASVQVANAVSTIAKMDPDDSVLIFKNTDTATVYLLLVYNDDSEFIETGSFYTAFTIHVDAVTSYVLSLADKILVPFIDGRGELDVLTLPPSVLGNSSSEDLTEPERDELEQSGHFLKLVHMPLNTQIANVTSVQIANSASAIARLDREKSIRIFRDRDLETATVYLLLVYNDDSEFIETGSFYTAFTIHVDAVTSYILSLTDKILVPFTDGRGELDARTLPVSGSGDSPVLLTEKERDELEQSGHFLKLTFMPLNTQTANVTSVQIANSSSTIAKFDKENSIQIFREMETDTATVYLPLVYNDDSEFTETGSFYTAFTIHVDAITSYVLFLTDKFLVSFTNGRGTLDVRTLPYWGPGAENRRYLTIYNLPPYLLSQNVSKVFVHNQNSPVAQCEDYSLVNVSPANGRSTVSVPLSFTGSSNSIFSGTGSFYVAFDIFIDALTHYTITAQDRVLVYFADGNGYLDIADLPEPPVPDHRYLTITGLPSNLLAQNVSNVILHNQTGQVAQCEDYSLVSVSPANGRSTVSVPLSFTGSSNSVFTGTGSFYIAFSIAIDALTHYTITAQDRVLVYFINGNGYFDIANLPEPPIPVHRYLTITNLPSNLLAQNVSNVILHNQNGPIAQCENYDILEISAADGKSSVRIPLFFINPPSIFTGTGSFIVAFDINIDANTRYTAARSDNVLVSFSNGNGYLDIADLPEPPITEHRYLTITNLPSSLLPQNVSNVMLHNQNGPVAQCEDYNLLEISVTDGKSSVRIPLFFVNPPSIFTGTGSFIVVFDINVDANTTYIAARSDNALVSFTNGNGSFDIADLPEPPIPEHRYLTITNLPSSLLPQNIKSVMIYNQAGSVAQCEDYDLLVISVSAGKSSVRIPLFFVNPPSVFTGTGSFIVAFDINIDANTRYTAARANNIMVSFTNGNGSFDVSNLNTEKLVPSLTIDALHLNTTKYHISNVNVYNLTGTVATCKNYNDIVVSPSSRHYNRNVAKIPLSYSSRDDYFQDTGRFVISFTVNMDIENQISVTRNDNVPLDFINGSATYDLEGNWGYYQGALTNPEDETKPIFERNTQFEIEGRTHYLGMSNYPVTAPPPASYSGVIYLYAYRAGTDVYFEFSSTAPTFNTAKKGHYNGAKRALWKMVYLHEYDAYLFKTYIDYDFPQLRKKDISSTTFTSLTDQKTATHYLSGADNPDSTTYTLQPGVYAVHLQGAGGGGGAGYVYEDTVSGPSSGGDGGTVYEVFTLDTATDFTAFTGSGGDAGSQASFTGTFEIYGTKNAIRYTIQGQGAAVLSSYDYTEEEIGPLYSLPAGSGGGGGGGGSGTFLFVNAPDGSSEGYFLCAGGGSGGSGGSYLTPGGAGGAGGTIGPGGGGGAAGYLRQSFKSSEKMQASRGHGGQGGGLGGMGGVCNNSGSGLAGLPGGAALFAGNGRDTVSGGSGVASYSESDFDSITANSTIGILGPIQGSNNANLRMPAFSFDTVPMTYLISNNIGSGGSAATVSFASNGPERWRNTYGAGKAGADTHLPSSSLFSLLSSPSRNQISSSNQVITFITSTTTGLAVITTFAGVTFYGSTLASSGRPGSDGGNNRGGSDSLGGGAAGGSRGSDGSPGAISIYKID